MALSIYISFGKNKGFKLIERDGPSIRTRLGVVSFCLTLTDVEQIIENLLSELREHDGKEGHAQEKIAKLNSEREHLDEFKVGIESQRIELVKQYEEQIESLKIQVSDLSDEVDEYQGVDEQNEELEQQINGLNSTINALQLEIRYLKVYLNL